MVTKTIYPNISLKELRQIIRENRGKFKLVKVPSYDGWRYALYTKGGYRVEVQKRAGQFSINY